MASGDGPVRVVLIDDHEMVAEAIALALRGSGIDVVARAGSLGEGLPLVDEARPDVVILDFRLPDGDAIDGVRALSRNGSSIPVLVVTAVADEQTAVDVLAAGAAGYVTKDLPIIDLADAVRKAASGDTVVPPSLLGAVMQRLRAPAPSSSAADIGATLTGREREALSLLATGSGIDEIAAAMFVSRNTARKHVQAVIEKLGAHSQLEAVAVARREGLL